MSPLAGRIYKQLDGPKAKFGIHYHIEKWAAYSKPHKMVRAFDDKLAAIRQTRRFEMSLEEDSKIAVKEPGGETIAWYSYWVGRP